MNKKPEIDFTKALLGVTRQHDSLRRSIDSLTKIPNLTAFNPHHSWNAVQHTVRTVEDFQSRLNVTSGLQSFLAEQSDLRRKIDKALGIPAWRQMGFAAQITHPSIFEQSMWAAELLDEDLGEDTELDDEASAEPTEEAVSQIAVIRDAGFLQLVLNRIRQVQDLEPRQFEVFTAELLERLGYQDIELCPKGKDGGVDVRASLKHALGTERFIVQCKRYLKTKVGEPQVKELFANVDFNRVNRGLMVTTNYLTRPAQLFINEYPHQLSKIDKDQLEAILEDLRKRW